jgi:hypothetical protein
VAVITAADRLQGREDLARARANRLPDDCDAPAKVVVEVAGRLLAALERALIHLGALEADPLDNLAKYLPPTDCAHARALVDRLGRGPGRRNNVVYWSPPAPRRVRYVGISRALDSRCRAHPDDISADLETLSLPPMTRAQAHSVEEVLIAHFGIRSETPTPTAVPTIAGSQFGQLLNRRHSLAPSRPDYCQRLGFGQALLRFYLYRAYATVYYTQGRHCLGIV